LIEKDELMQKIWHERFVEENNLTFNVKMLRKALGDDASKPTFIETVPKRGYRFIAEVRRGAAENGKAAIKDKPAAPQSNDKHISPAKFPQPLNFAKTKSSDVVVAPADWRHATDKNQPKESNGQPAKLELAPTNPVIKSKPQYHVFALIALLVGAIGLGSYFFSAGKTASGADGKKSIAVLPLKPINTANRDEIYEIGIADSLIHKISSMKGFVVRPLSATRQYADIEQDALAAGNEQQVDYVLASNYQLAGGKIRVTSQLFDVASGQIEETYKSEKDTGDFFAMQDAVADEIGRLLLARFATTSTGPAAKRGTTNEEAYRFYLQGMFLLDRGTARQKAVEPLEQSVRLDPNYAQGWAGLAVAHQFIAYSPNANIGEEYQKSIEAINKALSLDPNISEAYTALCEAKYQYEWDFAGAGRACQRALELNPNSSLAHNNYARFLLAYQRYDEAIAEIKTAIDLDPTSFHNQRIYANILYFSRRYNEAVAQYKRLMQMNEENDPTYQWLIRTLEMQGKEDEAFEWLMKSPSMQKKDDKTIQLFKTAYQTSGWAGVLRERDKTYGESNFFRAAGWNARLGDKDKAFEYLEKAYQQRNPLLYLLQVEPTLDPLRDDPRFDELVRRVRLK
jgi:Tfp pilus assembly protein PilF